MEIIAKLKSKKMAVTFKPSDDKISLVVMQLINFIF